MATLPVYADILLPRADMLMLPCHAFADADYARFRLITLITL